MSLDLLRFMFNWMDPLMETLSLVMELCQIDNPKYREELEILMKILNDHRDMALFTANDMKEKYLDDSEKPEPYPNGTERFEFPTSYGFPEWARLKNLDNPETLTAVWKDYKVIEGMALTTLRWAQRLYKTLSPKAESTPNEEAPSSSLTDTKDEE
jgi:hypothetical protein